MKKYSLILLSFLLLSVSAISQAEVISITDPSYVIPNSAEGVLRPKQGMTMAQVEQRFGQPEQQVSAVGQPPITRWIYKDFNVFFENNLVIHSVVPHQQ